MKRFTLSKRRGGGIDPPTMDMTKDQLKSYITTYRQEMLSAKELKAKKEVLFQIAMDTYEAYRAVENKIAANTMAALVAGPGNHVTNRRKSAKASSSKNTRRNARRNEFLHLLNLPSASASASSASAASSSNYVNNMNVNN